MEIKRYYQPLLIAILFFAFVTRVVRLDQPKNYVFDEVYHAVTAKLIAQNDPRAYEWWNPEPEPDTAVDWLHPPYAKYTQAFFIRLFGENAFGWRFSSVLFGVGVIWLTAVLATELFKDKRMGLLAAGLASLDGLLLTQSRIAMNDIHVTFFILAALVSYIKYRQTFLQKKQKKYQFRWLLVTGLTAGLALGSKWSGLFVIGIIGVFEASRWLNLLVKKQAFKQKLPVLLKHASRVVLAFIVFPAVLYFAAYSHMFFQGKDLAHFKELHNQIIWYQTHLEATHTYQSRPWQWFLNLRPVWFFVEYNPIGENTVANIYAFGNPVLFWLGIVAILWSIFILLKTSILKTLDSKMKLPLSWYPLLFVTVSYLMVWLPWVISPRIMFFYHYTPAVPLLSIAMAFWMVKLIDLKRRWRNLAQIGVMASISFTILAFIIWYPHWTALPVPTQFADIIYFALPSWK